MAIIWQFIVTTLMTIVISIECNKFHEFKRNLFSIRNFDILNEIDETVFGNWTGNQPCLTELHSIKNGLENSEEWAFKLVDAWGKFPSGIFNANFFEPGSFSECFHIERNGANYKTQYCIGELIVETPGQTKTRKLPQNIIDLPFRQRLGFYNAGPSISLGICLPSACAIDQLESHLNRVIHRRMRNMTVRILKDYCQTEEFPSDFDSKDYAALGLLIAILILMAASTAYDILCNVFNYEKCEPLLMFSLYSNGKKIFSCESTQSPNVIQCLHGIRSIATMFVITGHTFIISLMLPSLQLAEFIEFTGKRRSSITFPMIITDTFFVISGLLQSIKLLNIYKRNGQLNIWSMYLHRYLRLTPMLFGLIFMTMTLVRFMGSGPLWPFMIDHFTGSCGRFWWSTLFYMQNYVNPSAMCYAHAWYLSPDMQLFLISPFVVYLIHRYKTKAIWSFLIVIIGSFGMTVAIHLIYDFSIFFLPGKYELDHVPTHARLIPWVIGIITGYIFVEFPHGSIQIPKAVNVCAWILSSGLMAYAVLGFHPFYQIGSNQTTALQFGLFSAFAHLFWSIPLCYIIFACARNSGGPINRFLSHPFWHPFSKMGYAMYLVHHPVILLTTASMKTLPYFNEFTFYRNIFGNIGLTVLVAIPTSLAFDLPIDTIDRLILGGARKSKHTSTTNEEKIDKKIS